MRNILSVDASPREQGSLTRALSRELRQRWRRRCPEDRFQLRDVGTDPPGFLSQDWIAAAFTRPDQRTAVQQELLRLSDELIGEVERADVIVIATPMHNYGMPAALKAWFDQVIRIGRTFTFDLRRGDVPLRPTMSGKSLVMLTSSGEFGFDDGGPRAQMNHLVPHIRTVSRYLGVARDHHIGIEFQEFGDQRHARSVAAAHEAIDGLLDELITPARSAMVHPAAT